MIRLIGRRLIIPQGDTGSLSLPTLCRVGEQDLATLGILDPLTQEVIFQKTIKATNDYLSFTFEHEDTKNLPVGKYVWDVRLWLEPQYDEDGALIGAASVHSTWAGFNLPTCEIREVAVHV